MEIIQKIIRDSKGIKYEVWVDGVDGGPVWEKFVAFGGSRRRHFLEAAREQLTKANSYINPVINKIPL